MLRGTQILMGNDAEDLIEAISICTDVVMRAGYQEIIVPSIWEQKTFLDKAGPELSQQMWTFQDKGGRDVCLIPEVTGIIQELANEQQWHRTKKHPIKLFYVSRCYRYEKPQKGRLREFTQFGIEHLYDEAPGDANKVITLLMQCLEPYQIRNLTFNTRVKRGLGYYIEDGFEFECADLGAQKQIAGGGRYAEGIGWAIGLERLLLAIK